MLERRVKENKNYPDKIKEQKEIFELQRVKQKKWLIKWSIYALWLGVIAMFVIRILHLLLPKDLTWLSETQINSLDKLLFSGTVGGILGKFGDAIFEDN